MGPTVEVRPEPDERYSCHPELGLQTVKKNLMVDCVKSCRQVDAYEYSDLLVVSRRVHSVEYIQQCSLRGWLPISFCNLNLHRSPLMTADSSPES